MNQTEAADRFASLSQRVASLVVARMHTYEYGLRGARGAVVAASISHGTPQIDRAHFRDYCATRDFAREFPGVLGFGLIRRVAAGDEASFVASARRDGWPDLAIRQLAAHDGERYVIQYLEPDARNHAAIGLDVASEATRRTAAETAMRSGAATLTAPITLAQASGEPRGFLLLLPIYRPDVAIATVAQREAAAVGWAFAPLIVDDVLRGLDGADEQYTLVLHDGEGADTASFYGSLEPDSGTALSQHISIPIFTRTWQAELRATPSFLRLLDQRSPLLIALDGALLAVLLTMLVYLLAQRAMRLRHLRVEQVRRAAIVDGSADAIIGESLDGIVTDWNAGAERLFGYPAALAVGSAAARLVLPPGRESEDTEIRAAIARGDWVPPFDTTRQLRDGSLADVSVTASPIFGPDGQCIGLSKTVRDIAETRRAQRALAQLNATLEQQVAERTTGLGAAQRDLRNIVDALPSMIGYWGNDLANRVANRSYAKWFGLVPEAMNGRPMRDVLGEQAFERTRPYVEAVLRGVPQTYERSVVGLAGPEVRHLVVHYLPDIVDGDVHGFYVLVQDLTELTEGRLKLAAAQRDNQALLQTLHQHSIVSVTDRAGRITDINESFCRISGYNRDELLGQSHRLINSGAHGGAFWVDMWRTVSSGQAWRGEVCNRAKDGTLYWVDSIISPFLGPDGEVDKYISIRTDVTARKRAETELLETSSLLKAVLAAASEVSIIATNVEGVITLFNRGAERLLGYDHAEVVGHTTSAPFHLGEEIAARGAALSAEYGEEIAGFRVFVHKPEHHGPESREWTYVRKDGGHVPVAMTVTAMRDDQGQLFGYLGVAHDVSRQKQYERSLREAMHKAKHANQAKSQFLAHMSHEIRTPLNAVIGLSYLLERTPLDAEQTGFLAKITLASKALLSTINDVLDLSKIEASELRIERAPFHLGRLLSELTALMTVAAEAKGIDFAIDAPGDLPVTLEGDSTRLHQILTNLLSNAIKFTERGAVRLRVRQLSAEADRVRLRFVVKDSGIGIAPEAMARVFTPFAQADASTTRRFGGTGLGLSIVKQLVSLMGGEMGVTSTPGVGSEFWLEVELAGCDHTMQMPESVAARPARHGLPGVHVLVVDDSAINLEVARRILELEGAVVRLAGNGQEAVDELLAQPDSCDVVLMDIHMPVLDGYDATRRIRSLGLTSLPIIALTAGALTSERRDAESAGMTDFISKPFEPHLLVSCIWRHVTIDVRATADAPAKPPSAILDGWPTIDGIDAADACGRFGGDVGLFTSLLRRLLNDFSDLVQDHVLDATSLDGLAARMHNLKGSAGTLGAKSIQRLAAQAEVACRAHQADQTAPLFLALTQQLHHLHRSAASMLDAATEVVVDDDERQELALDPSQLVTLLELLRQLDLAALESFSALSPQLRRALGKESYAVLHKQIDNLQFADAAKTLDSLRP